MTTAEVMEAFWFVNYQ